MKRWLVGLAIVLVFLGGGFYWLCTSLDFVVKATIERFAPGIVGAPVQVREVNLSAKDGRGMLRGIEVGNPPGYSSPRALRAGTVAVGIDPATIARDVVVIRDILVDAPEITYETRAGTSNLEAIQRNIEAYVKRGSADAPGMSGEGAAKSGRRYMVGRVTIRGARVTMTNPALRGGGLTFDLPDVDVRDIGRRQGGASAAEVAHVVTAALVSRIAQKILTSADLLRHGGLEGALDALRGLVR